MFCTKCGKSIPDDSLFCTGCGSPVKPMAPATPAQPVAPAQPAPVMQPVAPVVQPVPMAQSAAPVAPQPAYQANAYAADEEVSACNKHLLMAMAGCFGQLGVHDYIAGRIAMGVIKNVVFVIGIIAAFATPYSGAGAFFADLILDGLLIWATVDCFMLACGSFKDSKGLPVPRVLWGLSFAIFWAIYDIIAIVQSFSFL